MDGEAKTTPTASGVLLIDGSTLPIPGIYLLDANGEVLSSVKLLGGDAREELLAALTAHR